MLEASELRVGNKICRASNGNVCTVNWGIIKDLELGDDSARDYIPIALNAAILKNCGFIDPVENGWGLRLAVNSVDELCWYKQDADLMVIIQ
jgi:hypothetical protein